MLRGMRKISAVGDRHSWVNDNTERQALSTKKEEQRKSIIFSWYGTIAE